METALVIVPCIQATVKCYCHNRNWIKASHFDLICKIRNTWTTISMKCFVEFKIIWHNIWLEKWNITILTAGTFTFGRFLGNQKYFWHPNVTANHFIWWDWPWQTPCLCEDLSKLLNSYNFLYIWILWEILVFVKKANYDPIWPQCTIYYNHIHIHIL